MVEGSKQRSNNTYSKLLFTLWESSPEESEEGIESIEDEIQTVCSIYTEEISICPFASLLPLPSPFPQSEAHLPQFHNNSLCISISIKLSPPGNLVISENVTRSIVGLPPISLSIAFPFSYPLTTPPLIIINSGWLGQNHIAIIQEKLLEMYIEGENVLFDWISWIQSDLIYDIGLLDISSQELNITGGQGLSENVIEEIIKFSFEAERNELINSSHTCNICYEEYPGTQFIFLISCKHYFCKSCITEYCENLIVEANIGGINCPECQIPLLDKQLREFLSPSLITKYEEFSVRIALRNEEGVSFCPKCEAPAFKEEGQLAICSKCEYMFCLLCLSKFHPFIRCQSTYIRDMEFLNEQAEITKKQKIEYERYLKLKRELDEKMTSLSVEERKQLIQEMNEKTEILDQIQRMSSKKKENLSKSFLERYSKKCPNCTIFITKVSGCNKVICSNCNKALCWNCGETISGYDHYNINPRSECYMKLFTNDMIQAPLIPAKVKTHTQLVKQLEETKKEQVRLGVKIKPKFAVAPDQKNSILCPSCGALNVNIGDNYIFCIECQDAFCFLCGLLVDGEQHFSQGFCSRFT